MSKRHAHIALWLLIAVFVLSVVDAVLNASFDFIPADIAKLAAAILAGVAIGAILHGMSQVNGDR